MSAAAAVKTSAIEGERTLFRTRMVNGKPQIYFDALDESTLTKERPRRNSRSINNNTTHLSEPPKPINPKPLIKNVTRKPMKKAQKVTFSDENKNTGVYMTMEEISELIKVVQDNTKGQQSNTIVNPVIETNIQPPSQQQSYEIPLATVVQKGDASLAPISPREQALSLMVDKKRQKWMREKAEMDRMKLEVEYDQLKHQLSPIHQNERPAFPSEFSPNNKPPISQSIKQTDNQQLDTSKTRLMERKQQQWKQETFEKSPVWNPFGRPGAGAPNINETQMKISQQPTTTVMPYRPVETLPTQSNISINDQTRVPAAMRTNLLFGDVRFEDDVKTAKEMERRQWLDDLQKQIEENKRKKSTQQETERRQDFLQENIQPLVQEAANRHQPQQQKETSPTPISNTTLTNNNSGQETAKSNRHDSVVQQTYDKIVEATELAKYEKKAQLIEKLKRNGHKTDLLARTLKDVKQTSPMATQRINENNYQSPVKPTTVKIEPLQINTPNDQLKSNRTHEARRDEAVNTVDSTFRSDNSVQTDFQMEPHRQMFSFTREESDLPPQVPNHLLRNSKQNKKNVRIRSVEDQKRQRRSSATTTHSNINTNDDRSTSQLGTNRSGHGPIDILHRPLWNYHNPEHREYIPNSRRDPNYEKRQRNKQTEQGNFDQIDDVPKKATYSRWNSDGQLQQNKDKKISPTKRTHSTGFKQNTNSKDENMNNSIKPKQQAFVTKTQNYEPNYNKISSLDRYDNFIPYTRTDEILDPAKAFSPVFDSDETTFNQRQHHTTTHDDQYRRQNPSVQPLPYHVPPSRQEHILQQLTAIKENLVRRQQEVASSMNAIQV